MSGGKDIFNLDQPATLAGIGHNTYVRPKKTRKAKRQRISVLDDELSRLTEGDAMEAKHTLENLYELAKMSHSSDRFYKDFAHVRGIKRVLDFLSVPAARGQPKRTGDPECVATAANLTYLCIMRGPTAKEVSDAFVEHEGVELFLNASNAFVLADKGGKKKAKGSSENEQQDAQEEIQNRYNAASAVWLALGMIFCKSGNEMTKEQHLASIDAILDSMDKLSDMTNKAREQRQTCEVGATGKNATKAHAHCKVTKTLHGVFRALNYLIDHISMTKEEIDSRRLFQRCHAVAKIPEKEVVVWETITKSRTRIIPSSYKTDDATVFLNTKIFFVSCFQNGLLHSKAHFEEAVPLCVETILRNSAKASKNARNQDRRHSVFDLMLAACQKVHKTTLEKSGILGAIEATLLAEGTVKSSSKTKARELLKAVAAAM